MVSIGGQMIAALRMSDVIADRFVLLGFISNLRVTTTTHICTDILCLPTRRRAGVVRLYEARLPMTKHTRPRLAGG
jgi:hypothetical protein